jgi:hypothetical protein
MTEVFNVDTVERFGESFIRVQGRAYADVHVGDVLTAAPPGEGKPLPLTVIGIVTYGQTAPDLARMMTGALLVQGEDDGRLKAGGFLYGPT